MLHDELFRACMLNKRLSHEHVIEPSLVDETPFDCFHLRIVKDNLCLFDVGPQRKDRLDGQLTRCICVALTDLADAPDVNTG